MGVDVSSRTGFLVLAWVLCGAVALVVRRMVRSPYGRVLRAIREDEILARAAGKNVTRFLVSAFAVSAVGASASGAVYAHYMTFIDPSSFGVMESVLILSAVIIGGAGSRWGPLAGATVLVVLPEILRFVGMASYAAACLRQVLYGVLLVAFVVWHPRGLLGDRHFGMEHE
jgi:branched-chain amino acid transport system permease protein